MMAEESGSPEAGAPEEPTADLLAERRARRANEGDPVLLRRAEAAEAAVRNLEIHLAALERRLEETGRHVRDLDTELAWLRERDMRLAGLVRELIAMAGGLRVGFERELGHLRTHLEQRMDSERHAYVHELTAMGERIEELRGQATRAVEDLRIQPAPEQAAGALLQSSCAPLSEREAAQRREMADALVAAVDRLRARVAEVKADDHVERIPEPAPEPSELVQAPEPEPASGPALAPEPAPSADCAPEPAPLADRAPELEPAPAPELEPAPAPSPEPVRGGIVVAIAESYESEQAATARPPHRHSRSLFARWRNRRKQRHSS